MQNMKLKSTLLSLALAALPAASATTLTADAVAAPKAARTADDLAGRVQSFYNRTQTFQADFTQRYTIKAYSRTKDSSGKVTFEKPGKMSWRYTTNGNRVVSDGKVLRVYEEDNKQMYEQPMDQSQYPAALAFLVGEGDIRASFKLQIMDSEKAKFEGGYVLVGEPRQPTRKATAIVSTSLTRSSTRSRHPTNSSSCRRRARGSSSPDIEP